MASCRMNCIFLCCAVAFQFIGFIDATDCSFSQPAELLRDNALVTCNLDIHNFGPTEVACPRRVKHSEYVWHPQPDSNERAFTKTYVVENGIFRSVALSDVLKRETPGFYIHTESNESSRIVNIYLREEDLYAITGRRAIFICGPRDLVLTDTLQRLLDGIDGTIKAQSFPWTPATPLSQEIAKIGSGLGIFYLIRGRKHMPLQGCGNLPSPLFAADHEVTVDPISRETSCVVDPMSEARIGFLCSGRIEPPGCMRSLLDSNGNPMRVPSPYPLLNTSLHKQWVVAKYFTFRSLPPINGECKCIHPKTGRVSARIEVRSKTDYICDIASKILRNRSQPISGPWCSVVLHPGSTLTIKFPINNSNLEAPKEGDPTVTFSQMMSLHEYQTEFQPYNLNTLRQVTSGHDVDTYNEIPYHDALVGDALELDVSQMQRGEVKLKYHVDKPLSLKRGTNAFRYHLTLTSRDEHVLHRIQAIVNISFAFTHFYNMVGCDRGTPSLFNPEKSKRRCSTKSMENGIGSVYECLYYESKDFGWAGIHCGPEEELLPDNCASVGYDLYSNRIMAFPRILRSETSHPIGGFQTFSIGFQDDAIGYACICVDKRGYETSKLILEFKNHTARSYEVERAQRSQTSLSHMLLPWHRTGSSIEGSALPEYLMIHYTPEEAFTLEAGDTLSLYCEMDLGALHIISMRLNRNLNPRKKTLKWFPEQPDEFYYIVEDTPNGSVLVRRSYNDSIATTPGALEVVHRANTNSVRFPELTIRTRRSGILISKDPTNTKYVPMTFVCGNTPKQTDVTIAPGNASTSDASAQPTSNIMRSSTPYVWHVVDIDLETTDPYMQGCGVTYSSTELFKPETPKLYDADGELQFGCQIDIQTAKEAAFYCPAPYVLDPPNCFNQVYVEDEVKNLSEISQSMIASASNHFVILNFDSARIGPGETLRQTPPLECRCVTVKGVTLSTIKVENYYAK
ncbi:hypothetical protein BBBOND_0305770 [Babesia bigemina]|uniref:6-Cys domain-containing protein n=1 Tax=Babesia bigemina TaxID=5866 RepID=A0A061D7Z9_BABBI|nr:hypothetical protein BBBOND_0305770 [Babesia bigemina]CDR96673.1 hypothetical protein BBBOND_0305770 [Babesia bigemina]|eukprot:XP_012768859.1 hypothetical protein BBBOND_0305770 [Babesia bigemina]